MTIDEFFVTLDATGLHMMVTAQHEESLTLDFKRTRSSDFGHADDRKLLAKCISGFANSAGGLIVWGVDARPGPNDIDCAQAIVPIDPIGPFVSRLKELGDVAVAPALVGVEHRTIPLHGSGGCAVTLVPQSDGGPHMAKLGEDRYYQRVGDKFLKMEHYAIADMFGRRRRPVLEVDVRRRDDGRNVVSIRNTGRGTARGPYLKLRLPSTLRRAQAGIDGNGNEGLPRLVGSASDSQGPEFAGNAMVLIHPNQRFEIAAVEVRERSEAGHEISYQLAAEDFPLVDGTVIFRTR
jgi:hypothetical protein